MMSPKAGDGSVTSLDAIVRHEFGFWRDLLIAKLYRCCGFVRQFFERNQTAIALTLMQLYYWLLDLE